MKIIKSQRQSDFNGSFRKYFDCDDIRLIDVLLYKKEARWHCHKDVTEILFVLDGDINAKTEKTETKIKKDDVIIFEINEYHKLEPVDIARVLVVKYIKTGKDLISVFSGDWVGY